MVRPSSVLRCPSQGDATKKDIRFCASRSLQCWVHRAQTSVNQPSHSGSRRISQLTFAAENDCEVSARTNVRVCVSAAGKPTGQLRQAQYVRSFFFYFDRVCVRPPIFFPFEVFCFVYFFKVLADIVCVPMRRRTGLANNFQDAWCARTVFRVCVCFILFGLFTLLGTVFE